MGTEWNCHRGLTECWLSELGLVGSEKGITVLIYLYIYWRTVCELVWFDGYSHRLGPIHFNAFLSPALSLLVPKMHKFLYDRSIDRSNHDKMDWSSVGLEPWHVVLCWLTKMHISCKIAIIALNLWLYIELFISRTIFSSSARDVLWWGCPSAI